jgi:hypothetical protein
MPTVTARAILDGKAIQSYTFEADWLPSVGDRFSVQVFNDRLPGPGEVPHGLINEDLTFEGKVITVWHSHTFFVTRDNDEAQLQTAMIDLDVSDSYI